MSQKVSNKDVVFRSAQTRLICASGNNPDSFTEADKIFSVLKRLYIVFRLGLLNTLEGFACFFDYHV